MYAVIHTGGKQYRVEKGEQLEVERLVGDAGSEVELTPVLVVDGDAVLATRRELSGAKVKVKVVGDTRGPKIDGFTYKPKSNQRRHYGHRQDLSVIEVTSITKGRAKASAKGTKAKASDASDATTDADADTDSTSEDA